MPADGGTPAKYQQDKVETVIFDIAVESRQIAAEALIAAVVGDPDDEREMDVARQAISNLREHGLLTPERADGTLGPTAAGVKAAALRI